MDIPELQRICREIADDMKNDASHFDGKPFNGRTVAEYFGNQGAAIAGLAHIIEALLADRGDGLMENRTLRTRVEIDPDLHAVAEWMQRHIPAVRLVSVARGLYEIAPLFWGRYETEAISGVRLVTEPISAAAGTRAVSIE